MSNARPLVSIIIPVYNGSDYLRDAIDSALTQTYKSIEILVVNDGSSDNGETERIALTYGNKIRYFTKPNGGVASALNMGISQMRGEYFSWLSHDDMYFPDKIETQINMLSGIDDKTTIVFGGFAVIDSNGKETHRVLPLEKYSEFQLKKPLFALIHGMISGCALLIHKSHFERAGVFDENLPTTQDFDLWFRIMRNAPAICCPGALSMTRVHDKQGSVTGVNSHSNSCDELWIGIMESMTDSEKIDIDGSLYNYYKNIYCMLSAYSSNSGAIAYAKHNAKKYGSVYKLYASKYILLTGEFFKSVKRSGITNTVKRIRRAMFRLRNK